MQEMKFVYLSAFKADSNNAKNAYNSTFFHKSCRSFRFLLGECPNGSIIVETI